MCCQADGRATHHYTAPFNSSCKIGDWIQSSDTELLADSYSEVLNILIGSVSEQGCESDGRQFGLSFKVRDEFDTLPEVSAETLVISS